MYSIGNSHQKDSSSISNYIGRPQTGMSSKSAISDIFAIRPQTSGSGIGGLDESQNLNTTMYAKAGSPMKQEKGMVRKWINQTGMKDPNDFHPSSSIKFDNNMRESEESLQSRQMQIKPKTLARNSRKLQEYDETQEEDEIGSGSQTPPGNDDEELGVDVMSMMQVTTINFIKNDDIQEKFEKELTVNDEVEEESKEQELPDMNFSEINKYLADRENEQKVQEPEFDMSEINKYLDKGEHTLEDQSEINKYLDKGEHTLEDQSDWMNGIGGISEMQQSQQQWNQGKHQQQEKENQLINNEIDKERKKINRIQRPLMNKSSIVFGGYDKKILSKDHPSSSQIDETEQSDEEDSESRTHQIEEEEEAESELLSVNKAHLDIRTNTKMGDSESASNFFDDRESIKSNMLGSLMGQAYQKQSEMEDTFERSGTIIDGVTFNNYKQNQNQYTEESIDNIQINIEQTGTFSNLNSNMKFSGMNNNDDEDSREDISDMGDVSRSMLSVTDKAKISGQEFVVDPYSQYSAGVPSQKIKQKVVKKKASKAYTDISLDIQEEEEESSPSLSKRNDRDSLDLAEELKIPDNDDMISEISAKISEIKKPTKKIVVDKEIDQQMQKNEAMLAASFKLIDKKLDVQVFAGPGQMVKDKLTIKQVKQLGSGSQGDVFQVRVSEMRGKFVDKSRKIYNNEALADVTMAQMYGEFCIAKDLVHPNIVQYKYFKREWDSTSKNYSFHLLMELMEGEDMDVYLREQGRPYMLDRVKEIGGQIISGLKYLHDHKIIHQDLKPQNILFSGDYERIKLIDFGISQNLEQTRATNAAQAGTMRYMSPEQLNGKLSFKTDIWAFGCVMLCFVSGLRPFENIQQDVAMCMQIINNKQSPLDYALKNYACECDLIIENPGLQKLLEKCFNFEYTLRPSADMIYNDDFFIGYTVRDNWF